MPGSYIWTSASIWHKVGCTCSLDPNYVPCGCQGAGGYYAGPTDPNEHTKMLAAEKEKQAKEKKDADDLAAIKADEAHKKNLAKVEFLGDPKKHAKQYHINLTNHLQIYNAVKLLDKFKGYKGADPSNWPELITYGNSIDFDFNSHDN